jgi:nitrogen fixation NifU-like protein
MREPLSAASSPPAPAGSPDNVGELEGADAMGAVGNPDCGEMMQMWIKFRDENGKKVIDRATFQSFGCETAIAVAAMATQLIRGKTAQEALALRTDELAAELGPLPPMKIHCAQLVEGALRAALAPAPKPVAPVPASPDLAPTLLESMTDSGKARKIVFLDP